MLAKVCSAAVRGIDGYMVTVELDLANGLPNYTTVGLPDSAVRESRERVVSALRNSGYEFPNRRVTVNLAPAEFKKRGTQFDLPVALGVLAASGQLPAGDWMSRYCFLGELALDGSVQPVSGVLPMAASARSRGMSGIIVARANAQEAAHVGIASFGVASLREAAHFVTGRLVLGAQAPAKAQYSPIRENLSDVKGQSAAKRALEIAAAGGHHLLLIGPPGSGKSMLASRLPSLLPPLSEEEALEAAKIRSVAGQAGGGALSMDRPFRAPHHTITPAALIGGGSPCRPGEISLAHTGVLFLDEVPEFKHESLEALRVPLETGRAAVSRLRDYAEYPARFQWIAAMNPCPCGWLGHPKGRCICTPQQVWKYRSRISGPLLDRIDLQVEVSRLTFAQWNEEAAERAESSAQVRDRVRAARSIQSQRFKGSVISKTGGTNANMVPSDLKRHCPLGQDARLLMEAAAERLALSARSLDRVLKLARTIADLDLSAAVQRRHVAEALSLSGRERWNGVEAV